MIDDVTVWSRTTSLLTVLFFYNFLMAFVRLLLNSSLSLSLSLKLELVSLLDHFINSISKTDDIRDVSARKVGENWTC